MRDIDEFTITTAVKQMTGPKADPRLREIMDCLVSHLHDFAREVKLTEAEWFQAVQFLTQVGQICDDKRQEFILLSDTLGLSTLVTAQNNRKPKGCTEATVFGPFYVEGSPLYNHGDDISNGAKGVPCFVSGTVKGLDGLPIGGAELAVWQSDDEGFYDVQRPEVHEHQARGRLRTRDDGSFDFRSILAVPYPIPHDGPVGKMLDALDRHPWRPAHLHFMITAPGYERLITHIFNETSDYLESDAVFGVRSTLVVDWDRHEPGTAPNGTTMNEPYYTVSYDFVLNPQA